MGLKKVIFYIVFYNKTIKYVNRKSADVPGFTVESFRCVFLYKARMHNACVGHLRRSILGSD